MVIVAWSRIAVGWRKVSDSIAERKVPKKKKKKQTRKTCKGRKRKTTKHCVTTVNRKVYGALAGAAQWTECGPVNQRVSRSIPSLGHMPGLQARSPVVTCDK